MKVNVTHMIKNIPKRLTWISLGVFGWNMFENYGRVYCTTIHTDHYYHRGRGVPTELLEKHFFQDNSEPPRVRTFPIKPWWRMYYPIPLTIKMSSNKDVE